MRGEKLGIEVIVDRDELHRELTDQLSHYFGRELEIVKLDRRVSEYCSSFIIEELDVTLDDGTTLELVFKDLSRGALLQGAGSVKPWFFYEPMREIDTYRKILVQHNLGTATCFGAHVDPEIDRYWLFLERVQPVLLWQMGELDQWEKVARWLAGMHHFLVREAEVLESGHIAHLIKYDRKFYERWIRRAVAFVGQGDKSAERKSAAAIDWLGSVYEQVVERLLEMPVTVIHGEFFASNVMINSTPDSLRVCPVDWEMAAVGPGLVDLAGLTSGGWPRKMRDAIARAYYDGLPGEVTEEWDAPTFMADLDYCRLHQAVQWLGWSPSWSPPPEHKQDWLKEAIRCAEQLRF